MDNNLKDFQERLEKMLLFQLTINLKSGKLSSEDAQEIARDYLALNPNSKEELLQGLINIGHTYDVIQPVIARFSEEFDEEFKNEILSKMHGKINQGDMDSAVEIGNTKGSLDV